MKGYFARLAGIDPEADNKKDIESTKVLGDNDDKSGEDQSASLLFVKENFGSNIISTVKNDYEDPSSKTISQINIDHKYNKPYTSISKREEVIPSNIKANSTNFEEAIKKDVLKRKDNNEIASSLHSSIASQESISTINGKDVERTMDSDRKEGRSTTSIEYRKSRIDIENDLKFNRYLERLFEIASSKDHISIKGENGTSDDNSYQLPKPPHNPYNLVHDSNTEKAGPKDDVVISIGTIVLNVTRVNNNADRDSASVKKPERNPDSNTSRLHRYYSSGVNFTK